MSTFWLILLLLVLVGLSFLARKLGKKGKEYAIPRGREVYQDLSASGKILRSYNYGLSGKPDMVKQKGNTLIPYEYKTTDAKVPRDGHIYQMVAYFLILEDLYPDREIPYGVLKYKNEAFRIQNIEENKAKLLKVLREMRTEYGEPMRNHNHTGRCFHCSFNQTCQQKLITSRT